MNIGHYRSTPIAWAPEAICQVINKYTDHYSYVFGYKSHNKITSRTNLVHHHNKIGPSHTKNNLIQYHSEPFRTDWNVSIPRLVIAQWPAFFSEYSNCDLVRNPIDIYDDVFLPKYTDDKIRIGYSPSISGINSVWHDKGYAETIKILNSIKSRFSSKLEIEIIHNVSLAECLIRKSKCNIFIDEVKTNSYHRSGLESMGMGIATICLVGSHVEALLMSCSGATLNPFINVGIDQLEVRLLELVELDIVKLLNIGLESRMWMERYWHPEVIANEYVEHYKKIIQGG